MEPAWFGALQQSATCQARRGGRFGYPWVILLSDYKRCGQRERKKRAQSLQVKSVLKRGPQSNFPSPRVTPTRNDASGRGRCASPNCSSGGGIYLSILYMIPDVMLGGIHLQHLTFMGAIDRYLPGWILDGMNVQSYLRRYFSANRG
jgi:hypothetical protein